MRCIPVRASLICAGLTLAMATVGPAGGRFSLGDEAPVATRPWASLWIASLGRVLAACDVVFEAADRAELADTLEDRLGDYRAFGGIDRKRPLGLMWTWDPLEPPAIVFLPIQQIDELMRTATFDVVGFHKVAEDRYEIERPGIPYHVLIRSEYALFGEEVAAMQALRVSPDQLTRELRDKYDAVLMLDLRQVPRASKELWIQSLRDQFDPWLQPQDDEPTETATLRRAIGSALLDLTKRLILDVRTITLGARLDATKRQISIELTLQGEPGSELAVALNHLVVKRSEFSALMNRDASAGLAINWPVQALGNDLLAKLGDQKLKGSRLDAGIQFVGGGPGEAAVIAGLRGPEATALNAAIPQLIVRLEKSGHFAAVTDNADIYRGVVMHSVVPREIPESLGRLVGSDVEVLIGQGTQTVWLAAGNPQTLPGRLQQAIDAVEDAPAAERTGSLVHGRLSAGKWPTVVPSADVDAAKDEAARGDDGFSLTVEPVSDGLKIRFVAEEGILRLIGRDWARQVDEMNAAK
jgi:hypothetical protein